MQLYSGTSGFSYKEWKGSFYPEDLPQKQMLAHYATKLRAVEINNTFYRMPRSSVLEGWVAEVSEGFSFVLKASRRITHFARLKDCEETLEYLWKAAQHLGEHRGPILFQLPPNMKKDAERLGRFLQALPTGLQAAFEFRNPSWFDGEVRELLTGAGAALVQADVGPEEEEAELGELWETADWGYLRLRREAYDEAALDRWRERLEKSSWQRAWVFFKHESEGPRYAQALAARFGAA